jgi:hypothetical protein
VYGLEAIEANNGWAISAVGVSIVFTGLVLLSMSISRIHKVLDIWDNRGNIKLFKRKQPPSEVSLPRSLTERERESAGQFYLLIKNMDDHFSLQRLLYLAEISGIERPHSNLSQLLKTKIIKPDLDGFYLFDQDAYDRCV